MTVITSNPSTLFKIRITCCNVYLQSVKAKFTLVQNISSLLNSRVSRQCLCKSDSAVRNVAAFSERTEEKKTARILKLKRN